MAFINEGMRSLETGNGFRVGVMIKGQEARDLPRQRSRHEEQSRSAGRLSRKNDEFV